MGQRTSSLEGMEVRIFCVISFLWLFCGCDVEENYEDNEPTNQHHSKGNSPAMSVTPITFEWLTSLAEPWQYTAFEKVPCQGVGNIDIALLTPTNNEHLNCFRLGSVYTLILKSIFEKDNITNKMYVKSFDSLRKKLDLPALPDTKLQTLLLDFDHIFNVENDKNAIALAIYTGHWVTTLRLLCDCYNKKTSVELNEIIAGQIVWFEQMQLYLSFFENKPEFEFYYFLREILKLSKHFEQVQITNTPKTRSFALPDPTIQNIGNVVKQIQYGLLKR